MPVGQYISQLLKLVIRGWTRFKFSSFTNWPDIEETFNHGGIEERLHVDRLEELGKISIQACYEKETFEEMESESRFIHRLMKVFQLLPTFAIKSGSIPPNDEWAAIMIITQTSLMTSMLAFRIPNLSPVGHWLGKGLQIFFFSGFMFTS